MKSFTWAIFLACFIVGVFGEKARFDNYRVYSIEVETEEQLELFNQLEKYGDGITFMDAPHAVQQTAEVIVPPHKFADFSELIDTYNMTSQLKTENLQQLIDEEQVGSFDDGGFGWKKFYDLNSIYAWLDDILDKHPDKLTGYEYGQSYKGRPLRAIKVSHKKGNPTIFIESTIHAREWITAATTTYIINALLKQENYQTRRLAQNFDWIFVPVANPDGYQYTHTSNRMWRGTRQPHEGTACKGADPNRNWDFHHAEQGASKNPCSELYAGPYPWSEPCVKSLSEFITSVKDDVKLYISFHSFSQLILFPYGNSYKHAHNHDDLNQIAQRGKRALSERYGTQYRAGTIAKTIYLASGSSIDWVHATQNVSLTFAFEFRDKGKYGFLLPPQQIEPNSLEVIDALDAMIREGQKLKYL